MRDPTPLGMFTVRGRALPIISFEKLDHGVQVGSGLFATDDIFNEGPLNRHVSDESWRSATG